MALSPGRADLPAERAGYAMRDSRITMRSLSTLSTRPAQEVSVTSTAKLVTASPRDDPRYDRRRVIVYFVALVVFYGAVVAVVRPGREGGGGLSLGIMLSPTMGALAAVLLAHGRIRFGRPTRHLLLAFLPPTVVLLATWAVALVGGVEVHPRNLPWVVALSPLLALSSALPAAGEEFGWRGFLWPLLRRHCDFGASAVVMLPIWWLYHLPVILFWGYGSVSGLPAFTVAITGFTLFVCFLTERSGAVWPSTLAHGAWNGLVATAYLTGSRDAIPACTPGCPGFAGNHYLFTGPQNLLGEFGWIAAVSMLLLGLACTWWNGRHPVPSVTAGRA